VLALAFPSRYDGDPIVATTVRNHTTSTILRSLASSPETAVPVRAVMAAMGSRAHGIALILFALPEALPLPLPSLSSVLGIPLVIVAAHLVLAGEDSGLPERVLSAKIPTRLLQVSARYLAPVLEFLELLTAPRLSEMLRYERLLGLVCLFLAVVLLLPLPFVNLPPALCLIGLALGMVQRDGVLVVLSLVGTLLLTLTLGVAARWLIDLVAGYLTSPVI
jgi:hypothetical protein